MVDSRATDEGVRLSKLVAAQAGCSRRQAELTIGSGAVTVDGIVVDLPETRVRPGQVVRISDSPANAEQAPPTLLWNKPADVADTDWPAEWATRWTRQQRRGWACATPLANAVQGLVVITLHPGIWRRLQDRQQPLECEYLIDAQGGDPAAVAAALKTSNPGLRASLSSQRGAQSRWRVVTKSLPPLVVAQTLENMGLTVSAMRRQRVGRVALGDLDAGQWRELGPHERF